MSDLIIIGSGPAGLTAAIYAARADFVPTVIAGVKYGGQLMQTSVVENYPGFPEGILGPELMQNMLKQAEKFGAKFIYEDVESTDFTKSLKKVSTTSKKQFEARAVIIAAGSSPRRLNIPGEEKYWGKGVSTCATCDAPFYRNRTAAVIGGGDSAMEEASFLTKFADKVYIVHRRSSFRASKIMQDRVLNNSKIHVIWNSEVVEIMGEQSVTGLKLQDQDERSTDLKVDGVFLAIGHIPNTSFLDSIVEKTDEGFIAVKEGTNTYTNIEGVFVAGDIYDHHYQQAITAAGMGCMAALDAQKWLEQVKG